MYVSVFVCCIKGAPSCMSVFVCCIKGAPSRMSVFVCCIKGAPSRMSQYIYNSRILLQCMNEIEVLRVHSLVCV